jgi:hypothetical protein
LTDKDAELPQIKLLYFGTAKDYNDTNNDDDTDGIP